MFNTSKLILINNMNDLSTQLTELAYRLADYRVIKKIIVPVFQIPGQHMLKARQ
jgi:hypothetical protein